MGSDRPTTAEIAQQMRQGCLALRARMLSRVITGVYEDALRPLGLRASQHSILAALGIMGDPRPTDLARELRLEPSTVSRNLSVMKRRGWVTSVAGDDDRSQRIKLTAAGEQLMQDAYPIWQKAQDQARKLMSPTGGDAFVSVANHVWRDRNDPTDS